MWNFERGDISTRQHHSGCEKTAILTEWGYVKWPGGLKIGSATSRFLGMWVQILPGGGGHGCQSVVSVVCCQVEVSATSWSLVQRCLPCVCPWVWSDAEITLYTYKKTGRRGQTEKERKNERKKRMCKNRVLGRMNAICTQDGPSHKRMEKTTSWAALLF
jgi:hypothetical protein